MRGLRVDALALVLSAVGLLLLLVISRLNFLRQDANFDLLHYHAYVPASLIAGTWFLDVHPASIVTYLAPYQDLLVWPLLSGVPAPLATAALIAVQVSIFIPVGLILHTTAPAISRSRALAIAFIGVSGAMVITELGTTMGDALPALLVAWAVYLLLSLLAGATTAPGRRAVVAAFLVGVALALKLTVVYVAPGMLLIAVAVLMARGRRSALLFLLVAPAVAMLLYLPWGFVLQDQMGSPVFPLFNAIFQAPRFPAVNYQDTRFPVRSLVDLAKLPLRQALGTASTIEIPFRDVRWLLGFLAIACVPIAALLRAARGRSGTSWRSGVPRAPAGLTPGLALIGFWCLSYVTWAIVFGIQRYAMLLEVLAVPVIVTAVSLAAPALPRSKVALPVLGALVVLLAASTKAVDFGRHPMGWAPIVPTETVAPLTRYDGLVIAMSPLAYLRAVTRDAPGSSNQVWVSLPFNEADRTVVLAALRGRSIGVVFEPAKRAVAVASGLSLGLGISEDCQTFDGPMWNPSHTSVEVCAAQPGPVALLPP